MSNPLTILAIDPGPKSSGVVRWTPGGAVEVVDCPTNDDIVREVRCFDRHDVIVCEWITSYGMAVGADVFETCRWVGQFQHAACCDAWSSVFILLPRRDIKLQLCGSSRAKDANVRQALLDRFPATGSGKVPQVGTKSNPGPLYGVSGHAWSALAVAVAWWEIETERKAQEAR